MNPPRSKLRGITRVRLNTQQAAGNVPEAIQGYAYAGPFVGRAAYDWSCEMTVYLDRAARKRGLGRRLYEALEAALKAMGILNLYACIGYPAVPDEYLTTNSADFHAHLGFTEVGRFHRCGYKFDRWYDMIWMEKIIGEHTNAKEPVRRHTRHVRSCTDELL